MRTKFALLLAATFDLVSRLPGVHVVPLMLHAAEPEKKEQSFGEKLSAWLTEKERMAADLKAATERADKAALDLKAAQDAAKTAADGHEATLTAANDKVRDAEARLLDSTTQVSGLKSQVSAFESLFASIGFKPAELKDKDGKALAVGSPEYLAAFQAAFNAHIANGVSAKMAELGVAAGKLPAASGTEAETEEELQAALAAATDPKERGQIAAKLNKLRDAKWAAHSGRN